MRPSLRGLIVIKSVLACVILHGSEPHVWTLSSWLRAVRSAAPEPLKPVRLHAARNEWESFQIAARSDRPTRILALDVSDLVGENGARISAEHIRRY